jgi:hypothetical protein
MRPGLGARRVGSPGSRFTRWVPMSIRTIAFWSWSWAFAKSKSGPGWRICRSISSFLAFARSTSISSGRSATSARMVTFSGRISAKPQASDR